MQDKNISSDDYISLSGVKGVIAQILRFFISIADFLFSIFRRNFLWILGGALVGLVTGYLYYTVKQNSYKVSMIVEFTELNRRTFGEIIDQLNTLVLTNSQQKLASVLQVDLQTAKSIGFIDSRNMNDEPLAKDTSTRTGTFKLIVHVNSNSNGDTLQAAIVRYLNNNPYLLHVKESNKKIYEEKLAYINSELARLDSLKAEYNRFLASSKISSTIYNNAFNPAEIYIHSNNLLNQREFILRWLELNSSPVFIVAGFKNTEHPESGSLVKFLILFGLGGALAGFLIAMYRTARKLLIG
ncbi:MAG TPA: hypothetical protein VM012_06280 [Flavitalea sp.]|nr:hypothetical protein [Flavitalea sp.]